MEKLPHSSVEKPKSALAYLGENKMNCFRAIAASAALTTAGLALTSCKSKVPVEQAKAQAAPTTEPKAPAEPEISYGYTSTNPSIPR